MLRALHLAYLLRDASAHWLQTELDKLNRESWLSHEGDRDPRKPANCPGRMNWHSIREGGGKDCRQSKSPQVIRPRRTDLLYLTTRLVSPCLELQTGLDKLVESRGSSGIVLREQIPKTGGLSLVQLCNRFDLFLKRLYARGDAQSGFIILDKSTRKPANNRLASEFEVQTVIAGESCESLAEVPLFVDSRAVDHPDADLLPTHYGENSRNRTRFFNLISSFFDRARQHCSGASLQDPGSPVSPAAPFLIPCVLLAGHLAFLQACTSPKRATHRTAGVCVAGEHEDR